LNGAVADEDPLAQYFPVVQEALELRQNGGVTGESYWQSFAIYFD
jgi:hypothetical protein